MRADRRLYLDRLRSRLVDEASPEAAFLLAARGQEIPAEDVRRLELVVHEGRVMQRSAVPAPADPVFGYFVDNVPMAPEAEAPAPVMPPEVRRRRRARG